MKAVNYRKQMLKLKTSSVIAHIMLHCMSSFADMLLNGGRLVHVWDSTQENLISLQVSLVITMVDPKAV